MTLHDYDRIKGRLKSVADPISFLTNLFAHAPVGFAVWSADGHALLTNQAFMDIFHSEPPPEYNVLKDDILAANGMLALFHRAFAGETVEVPTIWYDPRDLKTVRVTEGRRVAISMTLFPLFKESGEIDYVAATYKDQTEIMLATEQLRLSEERSRLAQQVAHVGTFERNIKTNVTTWTPEIEALYGLKPGGFESTYTWDQLAFAEDRDATLARVNEAFETFLPVECEFRVRWPDGSVHWLLGRFQVLKDDEDRPHRLIGVNMEITEHKKGDEARRQAEAAVKESEEGLRITLNSIGDAVIATDAQGRVTGMNPVAEQLTGWPFQQATGKQLIEVFHIRNEETREPVENPVDRVLREGKVVGLANHTVLISRDGSERAIADSGAPIRDAQGELRGVVLVFQDQTEQRKAEQVLQRSEARFRRLADAGIIGIITADFLGNILEANSGFLRMVGYTAEEVISGNARWADMTPSEWLYLDERAIEQLKATGVATPWEKEYIRKDGTRIPVLVGMAMLDTIAGECVAFILDLTERKRAEAAVRESEARKTAVMEAALDGIILMDHEGRITEFNPAAERTFGFARHEVVGKPLGEMLIPSSLRSRHVEGLQRYLKSGEEHVLGRRVEVPALRKDGTEFPAEVAIVRIRSEGSPVFTGYIRDITERRQAAESELLRRGKEAAEEANAELEAFSYSVAHDLREPLRAINGFSAALVEDLGDGLDVDAKKSLSRIAAGAHRMSEIIDALLGLARLTRTEPRKDLVDLTKLAHIVMGQLHASEQERVVDFVAAEGLIVQGDPQLLRLLLENLLGNAWKFTRKRSASRIEFGREEWEGVPAFYVRDNGAGFNMALVDKLFAPFRRLHKASEFEGTGIGLATVQRIVRRHGGRVCAQGIVNEGATFRFTLGSTTQEGGMAWLPTK
jgi:PAS domain S-box-containing protein